MSPEQMKELGSSPLRFLHVVWAVVWIPVLVSGRGCGGIPDRVTFWGEKVEL